jgi:NAD-dependent dihydropyrimidine dehydrogenase PreA subunit
METAMPDIKRYESGDLWVEIDLDLCIGASECVAVCPAEVYELVDGKVQAERIADCTECGACEDVCPTDAIIKHSAW